MMIRVSLFLVLFFLFIVEGTVYQIFAPNAGEFDYQVIPRWMFMLILFAGIFRGRANGLFYAVIFGVIYDIVYSSTLGIYTFGMGVIVYLLSISIPFFKRNLSMTIITVIVGVGLLEYYVYGMMILLGLTEMSNDEFFSVRFLPTLLMNLIVLAVVAYPLRIGFLYLEKRLGELND
ncbi:rod shape-determining protein MreD [Salipaludibacillus sp. CF4.18]|uniref:rod shape-determining protein MreD n=1 Tax=Salipaludibacillus sp. CF4.18 TaxID=3373081 RepID=UPI003EE7F31F